MSDGKIIAAIMIPAGVLLFVGILAVLYVEHTPAQPTLAVADATPPAPSAAPPKPMQLPTATPSNRASSAMPAPLPTPQHEPADSPPAAQLPPIFEGFRGIKWGADLTTDPEMTPCEAQQVEVNVQLDDNNQISIPNRHTKDYSRTGDKLQFGTTPVGGITYKAFDGQFYEVNVSDIEPFDLATTFAAAYGPARQWKTGSSQFWSWDFESGGKKVSAFVSLNSDGFATADITCDTLGDKLTAVQKEEALKQLAAAKKDF